MLTNNEMERELLSKAIKARESAYCPYSHYSVGAALLAKSGKIYIGCNIESASYTPSNCAERTAIFKAVSDGEREFEAIAVVGGKEGEKINGLFPPCGVCRQVMMEFCNPKTFQVILGENENSWIKKTLEEILPYGFGPNNLKQKRGVGLSNEDV